VVELIIRILTKSAGEAINCPTVPAIAPDTIFPPNSFFIIPVIFFLISSIFSYNYQKY